jgi:hypothetical protein
MHVDETTFQGPLSRGVLVTCSGTAYKQETPFVAARSRPRPLAVPPRLSREPKGAA